MDFDSQLKELIQNTLEIEEKRTAKIKAKRKMVKNAEECLGKIILDKLNDRNGEC